MKLSTGELKAITTTGAITVRIRGKTITLPARERIWGKPAGGTTKARLEPRIGKIYSNT